MMVEKWYVENLQGGIWKRIKVFSNEESAIRSFGTISCFRGMGILRLMYVLQEYDHDAGECMEVSEIVNI